MRKLLGAMVLTAAILLVVSGTTSGQAQNRRSATKAGTVELIESKDGKFRFSVRDGEGKYLGGSVVGHQTVKEAKEAVEDLKQVLATATYTSRGHDDAKDTKKDEVKDTKKADSRTAKKPVPAGTIELIKSKDDKYRFSVRDGDGDYVGGSAVGHATEKEAKEAAEELKQVLATATYVNKKSEATKSDKDK